MKSFYTLLIILIPFFGFGQYLCSQLIVNDVSVDSADMTIDIDIYDGNTSGQPYPYIAFIIDNIGDTIQFGDLNSFGNLGLDTSSYSYTLNSFPIYPLTIYYVFGMNADTCILFYDTMQKTYIPDDNFEQELINLGYDDFLDDSVITANISVVNQLFVDNLNIDNLTGIEAFISLKTLNCNYNNLTTLDLSNNIELTSIDCAHNQITFINVINNEELIMLGAENNLLSSIDVSNNTNLINLICYSNQLMSADVRNGNNHNAEWYMFSDNPNLECINVDDPTYSTNNWLVSFGMIDSNMYFSSNCSISTSIKEVSSNKELLKVIDVIGQETNVRKNSPIFYIYDDGTVEKKVIIE